MSTLFILDNLLSVRTMWGSLKSIKGKILLSTISKNASTSLIVFVNNKKAESKTYPKEKQQEQVENCFSGDTRKKIFTIDEQAITLLKIRENVVAC